MNTVTRPPCPHARQPRCARFSRRGFNMVELLVALTISATLLAAALQAFDASWRGYKTVTEASSTHVVSRIVMHRLLAMIRTGSQFGPFPADVLDNTQNPISSTSIEFIADADRVAGLNRVTRIERRTVAGTTNQFELWYVLLDNTTSPATVVTQRPLIGNVREATFVLEYEPGPRLRRATIDLSILPRDDVDVRIGVGGDTPMIRLVSSAVPRQLQ